VVKKLGVPAENARQVAFAIAVKISRVGTKPNPYHVEVVKNNIVNIQQIATQEGINIAAKLAQT
jgi:hypothetical protein